MRTLISTEVPQINGGMVINQAYITNTIIKPLATGAISGAVIAYMFGQAAVAKYALAYALGSVSAQISKSLIDEVI